MKRFYLIPLACASVLTANAETFTIASGQHLADLIDEESKATLTEVAVTSETGELLSADDMTLLFSLPALESLDLRGVGYTRANNCPGISNNTTIKEIWWPNNVSFIGSTAGNAFERMHLPDAFNNPSALTRLFNNPKLVSLDFYEETTSTMQSVDGVIYGWDGTVLCYYPSGKVPEGGNVVIPEGVKEYMAIGSLGYNSNITAITLPSTFSKPASMRYVTEQNNNLEYIYVAEGNTALTTLFNDGVLYDIESKEIIWTSPKLQFDENLVIDGTVIESIPQSFLSSHPEVKSIRFTEGYRTLAYAALKGAQCEVVEFPASLESIASEAMHSMSKLKLIINRADSDPLEDNDFFQVALHTRDNGQTYFIGWTTFYGQPSDVKIGIPPGSKDLYLNSGWNKSWTHPDYEWTNSSYGYGEDAFHEYYDLSVENGEFTVLGVGSLEIGLAGLEVNITAPEDFHDMDFLGWEEVTDPVYDDASWIQFMADDVEPVEFADKKSLTTSFVMPSRPVRIRAVYDLSTGMDALGTDAADTTPTYWNLQGQQVDEPAKGIYIVRKGNKVSKVVK